MTAKPLTAIVLAVAALVTAVSTTSNLNAVPDIVGRFLIGALPLEEFVLDDETWISNELKGEWRDGGIEGTKDDIFTLVPTLLVFGVKADEVTAVKSGGDFSRFVITYKPDKNASSSAIDTLMRKVTRNIEAYTGEDLVSAGASKTSKDYHCSYKDFEIKVVKPGTNQVVVAIRKAT